MNGMIHGHEVLNLMTAAGTPFTRQSLRDAIHRTFGPQARFFTCSADNLSPDELIDFLAARGKFIESDHGFAPDPNRVCHH